jgi:hypothetical protein
MLGKARGTVCFFAGVFDGVLGNRLTRVSTWKEPILWMHGLPIVAQDLQQLGREHDVAILLAFALHHADNHPPAIYVDRLQADGLGDSQASGVTGGQDDAVFDGLNTVKKMQNLLGAEDNG